MAIRLYGTELVLSEYVYDRHEDEMSARVAAVYSRRHGL